MRLVDIRMRRILLSILLLLPLVPILAGAQAPADKPAAPFKLTVENIMRGADLVGTEPSAVQWSVDGSRLYFRWKKPTEKAAELYMLTKPDVNFTGDGKKIAFTMDDNLFVFSLADRSLAQMTSITRRPPPPDRGTSAGEPAKWYADQQLEIFQQFKLQSGARMTGGGRGGQFGGRGSAGAAPVSRRRPFVLKENQNVSLELSPDEKSVFLTVTEPNPDEKSTIVPTYVTRSGFAEAIDSRAKAGYPSRISKAGFMDTATGEIKGLDFGLGNRLASAGGALWSPDGKVCLTTVRAEDHKDAWLLKVDPATGKTQVVEAVHDEAWIGSLGLTGLFWWPDSLHVSTISEQDGFAHLYKIGTDGKDKVQLTKGRFEVTSAQLSRDAKTVYFTSSEVHPGETHFYAMPAAGGPRTKITGLIGLNQVFLSPDETQLAILSSSATRPPELFLQPNKPGAPAKQITLSTTDEFRSFAWAEPEVVAVKARDGADIYTRIYRPKNPHPARPAVIFIHGAGYLQNAHKGWSTYFREYMFNNLLLEKGYTVLDADYRGSSGYGRDCRTGIYRDMGGKDLSDVLDVAQYAVKTLGVDPNRIGCYGGSYGGFLTLMAMFKAPGVMKAGAALRPVTDWAHYSAGYTTEILNLPQKDTEAYKRSSPIYFADGLKGALLICHGVVDTNVHFQDTVRLVQRLIELGKDGWDLAIFPVENHSFENATSWTDEYKRIFRLFEANLKN
jgi:dipeptidyl aminopeptidase/acylaminoacyl peptidase